MVSTDREMGVESVSQSGFKVVLDGCPVSLGGGKNSPVWNEEKSPRPGACYCKILPMGPLISLVSRENVLELVCFLALGERSGFQTQCML